MVTLGNSGVKGFYRIHTLEIMQTDYSFRTHREQTSRRKQYFIDYSEIL